MKSILPILNKVFVLEFYRTNASLFLVVIGLGAGFMRGEDHVALALNFISSPLLLLIPICVWCLYGVLILKFNRDLMYRDENEFIYNVSLLGPRERLLTLSSTVFLQLLPAVFYATFLIALALKFQYYLILIEVLLTLGIILAIAVWHLNRSINQNDASRTGWLMTRFINVKFTKPFPLFFPEWIARRDITVLLGTKFFGLLLLYAAAQLYKYDTYDDRLILLAVLVCFSAQAGLIWNLHYFDNQVMSLVRNLPIPFSKRILYFFTTVLLLLIPELGMLFGNFPKQLSGTALLSAAFLGLSICILLYGFLYWKAVRIDQLTGKIFYLVMAMIVLILFNPPMFALEGTMAAIGLWLWRTYYYSYQPASSDDDTSVENDAIN